MERPYKNLSLVRDIGDYYNLHASREWQRLANRLYDLDADDAAIDLEGLIAMLQVTEFRFKVRTKNLSSLLFAVEQLDAGDITSVDFDNELEYYRSKYDYS